MSFCHFLDSAKILLLHPILKNPMLSSVSRADLWPPSTAAQIRGTLSTGVREWGEGGDREGEVRS